MNNESIKDLGHAAEPVYAEMVRRLDAGVLKPGQRVPPQMKLCRDFSVSRSTIQKVILRLTAEGRVASKRGGGTFVAGQRPAQEASNTVAVMCILPQTDFSRLQQKALEANHLLCLYNQDEHDWQADQERAFLEQVLVARHKGLLAFCSPKPPLHDELLVGVAAGGTRVIHLSPYHVESLQQEYLMADYRKVGYLAGASLMAHRPERIFMAGYAKDGPYVQLMKDGFAEALEPFGITYRDEEHWLEASDFWAEQAGPAADRIETAFREKERIAIFARGFEVLETIRRKVGQAGKPDLHCIAYTHAPIESERQGEVDLLLVHTQALMERALDSVLRGDGELLRVLVAPRVVPGKGTTAA